MISIDVNIHCNTHDIVTYTIRTLNSYVYSIIYLTDNRRTRRTGAIFLYTFHVRQTSAVLLSR